MIALGILAAAAAVVSFEAQYQMVYAAKTNQAVAALEAGIPDTAAVVFAALGIALALHGKRALRPRALNLAAVATSIFMNFAAAAGTNWRTVAIWVMPSIAYAVASDTAIGVIRAYTLARQRQLDEDLADEGTTPLDVLAGFMLWLLRLAMDPPGTLTGFRHWVITTCPVAPGTRAGRPTPHNAAALPTTPTPGTANSDQGRPEPAVPGAGARIVARKAGQQGRRRTAPPTAEDVAAHFATRIADGQLPSQREIRSQWHIGSDTAKELLERLKARMSTPVGR